MIDMKSILGYSKGSPYANNPYLDIFTPDGVITMEDTPIDLMGIDELGNIKKMKAGRRKPYKFPGTMVREVPMQMGGNPFRDHVLTYLFDEREDEETNKEEVPTAPSVDELDDRDQQIKDLQRQLGEQEQYNLAMQIASEEFESNPYRRGERRSFPAAQQSEGVNPYVIKTQNDLMSKYKVGNLGIWGDAFHKARKSDHNTGDAQDFTFDTHETADASIAQLMQEAKQRNIKYIIYNGRIWNPSVSQDWQPYSGPNPHKTHFHVSYKR